jgi:hypothetical protein
LFDNVKNLAFSLLQTAGGIGMIAASTVGEVGSAGISTPLSVTGAVAGVALSGDGIVRSSISVAKISAQVISATNGALSDLATQARSFPDNVGGLIGMARDLATGDKSKAGQKTGNLTNNLVSGLAGVATTGIGIGGAESLGAGLYEAVTGLLGIGDSLVSIPQEIITLDK